MGTAGRRGADGQDGCGCEVAAKGGARQVRWAGSAGLLAALAACGACCLLPLLLGAVGATSSWIARVEALQAWQPWFILVAAVALGLGFRAAYRRPAPGCADANSCRALVGARRQRALLWIAALLSLAGIGFELLAPLFEAASSH